MVHSGSTSAAFVHFPDMSDTVLNACVAEPIRGWLDTGQGSLALHGVLPLSSRAPRLVEDGHPVVTCLWTGPILGDSGVFWGRDPRGMMD